MDGNGFLTSFPDKSRLAIDLEEVSECVRSRGSMRKHVVQAVGITAANVAEASVTEAISADKACKNSFT
jgi:hypothetical protein